MDTVAIMKVKYPPRELVLKTKKKPKPKGKGSGMMGSKTSGCSG